MVLFEFRFKMQLFGECFNFCESVGILFGKGFFSRVAVDEMGFEHGLLFVDGNTFLWMDNSNPFFNFYFINF